MKKILCSLFVLIGYNSFSQTIDTTIKSIAAMKINNVYVQSFPKVDTCTHLGVRLISDDLKSTATFEWILLSKSGKNIVVNSELIEGNAYKTWNGNNTFPFTFIANKYCLTFKND